MPVLMYWAILSSTLQSVTVVVPIEPLRPIKREAVWFDINEISINVSSNYNICSS